MLVLVRLFWMFRYCVLSLCLYWYVCFGCLGIVSCHCVGTGTSVFYVYVLCPDIVFVLVSLFWMFRYCVLSLCIYWYVCVLCLGIVSCHCVCTGMSVLEV